VVVPVGPAGGGVLDVGEGLVRPVVEQRGVDALGFEQADDAFHERVIPRCQLLPIPPVSAGLFG
jgi:hypothetical protein